METHYDGCHLLIQYAAGLHENTIEVSGGSAKMPIKRCHDAAGKWV